MIAEESLDAMWADAQPLLDGHWRETTITPDVPLEVNRAAYAAAEAAGQLVILSARRAGQLLGYAVFGVCAPPHHQSLRYGVLDAFYVDPSARGRWLGVRLIRAAEEVLRARGCQRVLYGTKPQCPTLAALLERLQYVPCEVRYQKRLDGVEA